MNWQVGVITCPRENPTLSKTLDSLYLAGWYVTTIFEDKEKDGCYRNWRKCAKSLLDKSSQSDLILIAEDDIEVTKGLRKHLVKLPAGVVSLYTAAPNHGVNGWNQIVDLPKKSNGALATVWRPQILSEFLRYDRSDEFKNGTDTLIGMWCKRTGTPLWCHSPSFVRHTGDTSTIDPTWDECQQYYRNCKEWLPSADSFFSSSKEFSEKI